MKIILAIAAVGVLGPFKTFSTFSPRVAPLYERGRMPLAAGHAASSVALAVGGLFADLALVRAIAA
jgi:CrcB protein